MEGLVNLIAEKILNTLEGQKFCDWYENEFDDYITGGDNGWTKEDMLEDIKQLFNLHTIA